jgi:hypothetical protein
VLLPALILPKLALTAPGGKGGHCKVVSTIAGLGE